VALLIGGIGELIKEATGWPVCNPYDAREYSERLRAAMEVPAEAVARADAPDCPAGLQSISVGAGWMRKDHTDRRVHDLIYFTKNGSVWGGDGHRARKVRTLGGDRGNCCGPLLIPQIPDASKSPGSARGEIGGVELGQVAIHCRVSTGDQSRDRQERDLRAFARRAGHN